MPDDVTRAQPATTLLEESAEDLYENAPCGYLSTALDGTIVKVNRTLLTWTGYPREALLSRRFQDLLTVGGRIFYETHYAPLLQMQHFAREIAFDLVRRDRSQLPVLISAAHVRDPAGRPLLIRAMVFDVTDRREYERELLLARRRAERAAKAKADFLSVVSHEIRTPLNALVGATHLLARSDPSPRQERYIRILESSSQSLLSLVNDILDLSKIEAGKVSLREQNFDLRQLVSSITFGLSVLGEAKGLALPVDIDERVPAVLVGDPIKIGQVLTNLLSNAIKFTERGSVTLQVLLREQRPDAVTLHVSVTDTGIGIAADQVARIFDEFTQAGDDTSAKYGGTGLGLTICRRLLELHGSRMAVESAPGAGATFSFDLRLRVGQQAAEAVGIPEAHAVKGVRVLVAEDHVANLFLLSRLLRQWGVRFDVVESGRQAVERVQQREYDLVLMDLQMPELDGYDATQAIRALPDPRISRMPIIAMSGSLEFDKERRISAAGFTDFISKPFQPEQLLAKIAQYGLASTRAPGVEAAADAPAARLLLIDDNRDLTASLCEVLEMEDFDTRVAHDGPEALAIAAQFRPEIALVDIGLPGMSGYDLSRRLREQRPGERFHLVAMTGRADETDRQQALAAGFDAHVAKPMELDALVALLRELLAQR